MVESVLSIFKGAPRAAVLMSGQGSNARSLLQQQNRYPNLQFTAIVTDNPRSNAETLAKEFGLEFRCFAGFSKSNREEYFQTMASYLEDLKIDVLIYSGFMKITPSFFVQRFPGLNIHPADLTLKDEDGLPRYRGINALQKAIQNGETYIASTVHIVEDRVDCGAPIAVSQRLDLSRFPNPAPEEIHEALKTECEHTLFPDTLELISRGAVLACDLPIKWFEKC